MPEADDPKTGSTEEGAGFYRRWSRRKRLTRGAPDTAGEAGASPADAAAVPAPGEGGEAPEAARVLTDADMPDLDSLGEGDDFSPFMSPGVSEALRRKALRKLFLGGAFNVTDGLDDYDDDFTTFEALGDLVTSDMRHRAELEAERAREATQPQEGEHAPEAEHAGEATAEEQAPEAEPAAPRAAEAGTGDGGGPPETPAEPERGPPGTSRGEAPGALAEGAAHPRPSRGVEAESGPPAGGHAGASGDGRAAATGVEDAAADAGARDPQRGDSRDDA